MKKIGRNDPCPCGAKRPDGKPMKYKNCHLGRLFGTPQDELAKVFKEIQEVKSKQRDYLRSFGIFIDFVKPVLFQGKKVWALGNRVYVVRWPNQTFHEFLVHTVLRHELGEDWLQCELKKSEEEMHFIAKCCKKFDEINIRARQDSSIKVSDNLWRTNADGWSLSLLSLAFDIASLAHSVPQSLGQVKGFELLIERLKGKDSYQGARYELTIAAIFTRMGFILEYYDDSSVRYKHGEFIAIHNSSNLSIVVETKSRHRLGVIHTPGISNEKKNLLGDVKPLINRALKKQTGNLPFFIFIDINSPATGKETMDEQWAKDIMKSFGKDAMPTSQNPDPFTCICFTNYSYHYQTEQEAANGQNIITIPLYPKIPIKDPGIFQSIQLALNNYGNVPLIDMPFADLY